MKVPQTASSRHFRSALRAGVGCGDVTALSCFIFDPMCHPHFQVKTTLWDGPWNSSNVADLYMGFRSHLALDDPQRLEKSRLSKHPSKTAQAGAGMGAGVFPYSGGENRTQAHTGGTAGTIRLCCLLVFGISFFLGPSPKSFSLFMRRSFYTGGSILRSP